MDLDVDLNNDLHMDLVYFSACMLALLLDNDLSISCLMTMSYILFVSAMPICALCV